jgi:hypothetical protein
VPESSDDKELSHRIVTGPDGKDEVSYSFNSDPFIQRAMCLCYTIYRSMMSFFWCRGHVKGCVVLRVRRAGKRTGSVTALALERCGRGDVPSCSPFAHVVLLTEDPRD